jgi:SAM-dependent methyltransferase
VPESGPGLEDAGDGYVEEVGYTAGFYRELTPSLLRFAMLLQGVRAPSLDAGFTYCELGFGQGFSLNLLAAANPRGDFWGTDLLPLHVENAGRLAERAGTSNLRLFEDSFDTFLERDTPPFDFITLHGVYSWVTDRVRAVIVELIRRKLRPGGLVYVGYNAMPGWAGALPLRHLVSGGAGGEGPIEKLQNGMAAAERLIGTGAAYFRQNGEAVGRFRQMQGKPLAYLLHEYANRGWRPQFFTEVAEEMAQAGLRFAGSADIADYAPSLALAPEARRLLDETQAPEVRETLKDYLLNRPFRKDVFVRADTPALDAAHRRTELLECRFALLNRRPGPPFEARVPRGAVTLREDLYVPLLQALGYGPATLETLLEREDLERFGFERVLAAITTLVAVGDAAPCAPTADSAAALTLNRTVLERAGGAEALTALASPITGGGVPVGALQQLIARARLHGQDAVEETARKLALEQKILIHQGRSLSDPTELRDHLRIVTAQFEAEIAPRLRSLGAL